MRKPLLFLPLLLLCGCAREPSPVTAFALDRDGAAYRLTAEVVRQDDPRGHRRTQLYEAEGEDFPSLLHALESVLPVRCTWSHAQVLLLSEDAAADDLMPLAEYLAAITHPAEPPVRSRARRRGVPSCSETMTRFTR